MSKIRRNEIEIQIEDILKRYAEGFLAHVSSEGRIKLGVITLDEARDKIFSIFEVATKERKEEE